jgi:hypothetical protein
MALILHARRLLAALKALKGGKTTLLDQDVQDVLYGKQPDGSLTFPGTTPEVIAEIKKVLTEKGLVSMDAQGTMTPLASAKSIADPTTWSGV